MPSEDPDSGRQASPAGTVAIEDHHERRSTEPERPADTRAIGKAVTSRSADRRTPTLDPKRIPLSVAASAAAFLFTRWFLTIIGLQGLPSTVAFLFFPLLGYCVLAVVSAPFISLSRRRDCKWFSRWRVYGFGFGTTALFSIMVMTVLGAYGGAGLIISGVFGSMPGLAAAIAFQHFAVRPAKTSG